MVVAANDWARGVTSYVSFDAGRTWRADRDVTLNIGAYAQIQNDQRWR